MQKLISHERRRLPVSHRPWILRTTLQRIVPQFVYILVLLGLGTSGQRRMPVPDLPAITWPQTPMTHSQRFVLENDTRHHNFEPQKVNNGLQLYLFSGEWSTGLAAAVALTIRPFSSENQINGFLRTPPNRPVAKASLDDTKRVGKALG